MNCTTETYFVCVIKQIGTHAVIVKHCGHCSCSVKCLNLCKVCIKSSFIALTLYQILLESSVSWEMRNVIRILALLLVELSEVQAAGMHYKSWLTSFAISVLICSKTEAFPFRCVSSFLLLCVRIKMASVV